MSTTEKKRQAILKKQKKLGIRPCPENAISRKLCLTKGDRDRFTSQFPMELLAVETALAHCYAEHPGLDDLTVAKGLQAGIEQKQPASGLERLVFDRLQAEFTTRSGTGYLKMTDWRDAQRAILTSICDVSKLSEGYQGYLNYATEFVERTKASNRASSRQGLGFRTASA